MKKFLNTLFQTPNKLDSKDQLEVDHMEINHRFDDVVEVDAGRDPSNVNFTYPPKFNLAAFLDEMTIRYHIFNKAWNENNIPALEVYVGDKLFQAGLEVRQNLTGVSVELQEMESEVTYADFDGKTAKITVLFSGCYYDRFKNEQCNFKEKWYLERTYEIEDALWLVIGIKSNL